MVCVSTTELDFEFDENDGKQFAVGDVISGTVQATGILVRKENIIDGDLVGEETRVSI